MAGLRRAGFGWLAAALVCSGVAFGDEPHHALWRVKGVHNTVYLLGSVHVLKPADAELPPEALAAYARAGSLVLEVDLHEAGAPELAEQTARLAALPADRTLEGELGDETWASVVSHAREAGLDPGQLQHVQPWFAAMLLLRLELVRQGFAFESGVESQLLQRADADHKRVVGLETMADQLGLFAHLSPDQQRRFLRYTLEDVDDSTAEIDAIVAAWRHGDVAGLEQLLGRSFADFPELYAPLTSDRNRRWMPQLERLLHERQDCLVVVGALHLVGRDGLVDLLRSRGYTVVQR